MALPGPLFCKEPQQLPARTAPGTHRKPKTDLSLKRPSSKSKCADDGGQYIQRKLGMLTRSQKTTSLTMFLPSRPTSFSQHVLHRQPKLSSLGRQRELAEDHTSPRVTQLYAGTLEPTKRGSSDSWEWGTADFKHDIASCVHADSSGGVGLARHPAASCRWQTLENTTSSTCGRRSSEWETETLLDHSGASELNTASYPCPFRKRNPARFNIRAYEACARDSFGSIKSLKNHVITHHRRKPSRRQCRRCKQRFDTEMELEEHLLLPRDQVCEVNTAFFDDPEEGITDQAARILAAKNTMNDTWSWEGIWRLIFPCDLEIPDPDGQPVVELAEVQQAFDEGQDILKDSLREKLQLLLPGDMDDNYLSFLTGQLELVFETHRVNVMKQSLNRASITYHGAQPSPTHNISHHAPPQKQDRKSRRNTLLQSLHRPPPSDAPSTRRHSRPASTGTSTSTPSHLRRTTTTFLPASPPLQKTSTPTTPLNTTRPANLAKDSNPNPRDSRDSGIGMPCETCHQEEPCHCPGAGGVDGKAGEEKGDRAHDASAQQTGGRGRYHNRDQQPQQQQQQQQPRLSITTTDLCLRGGRLMEGEGLEGGRFSPESFKQRVLRKGFFDVMG